MIQTVEEVSFMFQRSRKQITNHIWNLKKWMTWGWKLWLKKDYICQVPEWPARGERTEPCVRLRHGTIHHIQWSSIISLTSRWAFNGRLSKVEDSAKIWASSHCTKNTNLLFLLFQNANKSSEHLDNNLDQANMNEPKQD